MGSILVCIYGGIATATETAGVGVVVTLIIAVVFFKMRWTKLREALREAAMINGMILFIIFAANFFTYVLGSTNVASGLQDIVGNSSIPPIVVIVMINVIVLILGCILDPITITLLTIPIFMPLIISLGYDPIWFTVLFCVQHADRPHHAAHGHGPFRGEDDIQYPDGPDNQRRGAFPGLPIGLSGLAGRLPATVAVAAEL